MGCQPDISFIKKMNGHMITNTIHLLIYLGINKYICDNTALKLIKSIINTNNDIELYNIEYYLKQQNYICEYFIKEYALTVLDKELDKIIIVLHNTDATISFKHINKENINKYINNDLFYIVNSFNDAKFSNLLKTNNNCAYINEMVKRLNQMYKLLGNHLITKMEIPILTIEEFEDLNYQDKCKYYNICINRLQYFYEHVKKISNNQQILSSIS